MTKIAYCAKKYTIVPRASVCCAFFSLDSLNVGGLEVGLGLVPVLVGVAELAVDLVVGSFRTELVVQGPLAVVTGETTPVIQPSLGRHLLGLEHLDKKEFMTQIDNVFHSTYLSPASWASFLLLLSHDYGRVRLELRPLWGSYHLVADLKKKAFVIPVSSRL